MGANFSRKNACFKKITKTEIFLSKMKYLVLIDGYCRKKRHYKNYIPLELCRLVFLYVKHVSQFFIIMQEKTIQYDQKNELLCFDIYTKQQIIMKNECWSKNKYQSYCMNYDNNRDKH